MSAMNAANFLDVIKLQSHYRSRPLKTLKNKPNWKAPNWKAPNLKAPRKSSPPADEPKSQTAPPVSKMKDEEDDSVTPSHDEWSTYRKPKPRAVMSCYGRGLPRTPIADLPKFSYIEEFEKSYIMLEPGLKSRGRGRGLPRARGASVISTQTRQAFDEHNKMIREQTQNIFGTKDTNIVKKTPVRSPKSVSVVGSGTVLTRSESNGVSSSSGAFPDLSSSRSSVSSSLASSHNAKPGSQTDSDFKLPQMTETSSANSELLQMPETNSVPSTCNSNSVSVNGVSHHSSFSSIKSSLMSDPSEDFCTPEDDLQFQEDRSVSLSLANNQIENRSESNSNLPSTVSPSRSTESVGSRRSSRSPFSSSSSSSTETNKFEARKNTRTTYKPNILHSVSSSSQEENYERPTVYVPEPVPKWEPCKPKGPRTWKKDDFPELPLGDSQPECSNAQLVPPVEEVSFKSIAQALKNKNVLEPVSNSEESDSKSSGDMGLSEFLQLMSDPKTEPVKPEKMLISGIPDNVTEETIRELLNSYNATITSMTLVRREGSLRAEILIEKCDGGYLVDSLNDTSPFGGDLLIKCELI